MGQYCSLGFGSLERSPGVSNLQLSLGTTENVSNGICLSHGLTVITEKVHGTFSLKIFIKKKTEHALCANKHYSRIGR
jgi:hypothetical protein